MTEEQWFGTTKPSALLRYLNPNNARIVKRGTPDPVYPNDRKLRLWIEACRIEDSKRPGISYHGPNYHDDLKTREGLVQAVRIWSEVVETSLLVPIITNFLRDIVGNPFRPITITPDDLVRCWKCHGKGTRKGKRGSRKACKLCQEDMVIPLWVSKDAHRIAVDMYDANDFSGVGILADAVEDAGCTNEQILSHLRTGSPHVRGCHIIDFFTGAYL